MGSPVHLSRSYVSKSHLQHGSKSWRGGIYITTPTSKNIPAAPPKLTSDKFEEKYANWYSCEIVSSTGAASFYNDTFGDNNERSVIVYNIQVSVHLNNAAPMVFCVRRRFNQWLALHEELLERNTTALLEKIPPSFPTRTLLFKPSTEIIHARAGYFTKYLSVLHRDPHLANAHPLLSFLELNSIVQSLSVGTVINVELTASHNLQTLKKVVGELDGVIYLRVDLRLSKVMIKGFIGTPTVTDTIKAAGFNIVSGTM